MDSYTLKKGTVCVDGGQGGSEASTRSGPPRELPSLEARGGPGPDSSSEAPEGTHFANTFTLDFWPPKLYKNQFLLPEAPQFVFIRYRSHGNSTLLLGCCRRSEHRLGTQWRSATAALLSLVLTLSLQFHPHPHYPTLPASPPPGALALPPPWLVWPGPSGLE